ncbi:MAG TPA: STAS domain-containing protein [Halioglobus sp.]
MREGHILAASHDGAYVIRLEGDVRLTLSTTMDDFFQHMFDDPKFASVWVDLCEVEGMDSTTLGLLAKLALRAKRTFGFTPAIFSRDPGINRLLKSMAFHRLFELHEDSCDSNDMTEIPLVKGSEESVKKKVIEAHRVPMDLSEENRDRFKDLLTVLERS